MADPLDILMPGGQPLGVPTKRSDVREINGSTLAEAKVLFDKLTVGGTAIATPRYSLNVNWLTRVVAETFSEL